jgi:hypothetical protein
MMKSRWASVSTMVATEVDWAIIARVKNHHQQRRFGEEADQHLAPSAQRAEGRADIHCRQRDEDARQAEYADQGDGVGRRRERQVGRQRYRDDGAGQQHAAEHRKGGEAEQGGRAVRQHDVLEEQLVQHVVRLQERRRRAVLEPGAALVHPAGEEQAPAPAPARWRTTARASPEMLMPRESRYNRPPSKAQRAQAGRFQQRHSADRSTTTILPVLSVSKEGTLLPEAAQTGG